MLFFASLLVTLLPLFVGTYRSTYDDLSRACGGHAFMAVHHPFSGSIFVVSAERGKCDGLCSITAVSQAIDASVQCPS